MTISSQNLLAYQSLNHNQARSGGPVSCCLGNLPYRGPQTLAKLIPDEEEGFLFLGSKLYLREANVQPVIHPGLQVLQSLEGVEALWGRELMDQIEQEALQALPMFGLGPGLGIEGWSDRHRPAPPQFGGVRQVNRLV